MDDRIEIVQGDLLEQDVDVIVNAANTHLEHMGGIAGTISRAGGPAIQRESRRKRPIPTGDAVATTAGDLPFKAVVHAVGPIWGGGGAWEANLLRRAHMRSIGEAAKLEARSVGFPAISCGIFRYPVEQAAPIALSAISDALETMDTYPRSDVRIETVRICLAHDDHFEAYSLAWRRAKGGAAGVREDVD